MGCLNEKKWSLIPRHSLKVTQNCPKCGHDNEYSNSECFRVNANGNNIDVWLIYRCDRCKDTYNLSIYRRVRLEQIPPGQYQKFLQNDPGLARQFGTSKEFFQENRVRAALSGLEFDVMETAGEVCCWGNEGQTITIRNACGIKIRLEKLLAEQLGKSRAQIVKSIETGMIVGSKGENLKKRAAWDGLRIMIRRI